jgi:hypothetical protein
LSINENQVVGNDEGEKLTAFTVPSEKEGVIFPLEGSRTHIGLEFIGHG